MKKVQFFQASCLAIIACCFMGIVAQNQIIIQKLSQEKDETPLIRQASLRQGQNFVAMPVNADGSIDVNIKSSNDIIDVNIRSCKSFALQYAFGGYPIDVRIDD